ncbi:MAG: hypothetical protein Q8R39_01740 [bacterium]|nr:hypothetical protein [bacterium]MDZ4285180.1 hypothetical protein [Patescibacteria group bacterium]
MDWGSEILDELEGKKKIPANVLALIRPSVALLDLGLPVDVLYEHTRWSIRDLLRRVHPDQRQGEMVAGLKTLSDAFDFIKDQEVFADALTKARDDRSYERLGERSLRARIQSLQDDIANLRARLHHQEQAHPEDIAQLKVQHQADLRALREAQERREAFFQAQESKIRFGEWFQSYLAGRMMGFASKSGSVRPITGHMQIIVASFAFSFSAPPDEKRKSEMYARYTEAVEKLARGRKVLPKEKSDPLRDFIASHNLAAVPAIELFERAKSSGLNAPEIRWSFRHARRELDLTRMGGADPGGVVQETSLEGWTSALENRYQEALEYLARGLSVLYIDRAAVMPQRITIDHQVFEGDAVSKARLYLLGTVDPAIAFEHHYIPPAEYTSPRLQLTDAIVPHVEPFLCPGRGIVGLSGAQPFTLTPIYPNTEWEQLMERKETMTKSKSTLFFSHIVLGVE